MAHINEPLGSLATPCYRCNIAFAWQRDIPRLGWQGIPCKETPYTSSEQFKINKLWIQAAETNPVCKLVNCTNDTLKCPRCNAKLYGASGYIYGFCRECAKYILNQYDAKEVN